MTTQPEETTETIEPTSDIITDDGVITPTPSHTKADLFDRSASWIVAALTLLVVVGVGFTLAFGMGLAAQKHEITSTAYWPNGACKGVQSFMIATPGFGEDPALFAKYQAAHPKEKPNDIGCPILFENNSNR